MALLIYLASICENVQLAFWFTAGAMYLSGAIVLLVGGFIDADIVEKRACEIVREKTGYAGALAGPSPMVVGLNFGRARLKAIIFWALGSLFMWCATFTPTSDTVYKMAGITKQSTGEIDATGNVYRKVQ